MSILTGPEVPVSETGERALQVPPILAGPQKAKLVLEGAGYLATLALSCGYCLREAELSSECESLCLVSSTQKPEAGASQA